MKSNKERLMECLMCKYSDECEQTVTIPEDYPDGSCKTKDVLAKRRKEKC